MISRADVDKLLDVRAAGPCLLSLYVQVPVDPAGLRGLPAHVGELFALAARDGPGVPAAVRVGAADARTVLGLLASRARDWLDHTVAIFACADLGLAEAIPLPCRVQERAVLAARPHVRPLLLAIQRCPAYRVVVVNRRRGWLFSIEGTQVSTAVLPPAGGMRGHGFSGWYGLQAHRVNERIIQLARHHYHDTAALLEQAVQASGAEPVIIGGHQDTIPQFLGVLPAGLRDQFAGCFMADPHTLTPAKVRDLADRVIQDWRNLQDQRTTAEFVRQPPAGRTATGLSACLAAAGQHAIQLLLVPAGGLVPGYACRVCGALSSTGDGCPHGVCEAVAVPDLIEELAVATLADGGQVETLPDPPGGIAAHLRHPLRLTAYTSLGTRCARGRHRRICSLWQRCRRAARCRLRRADRPAGPYSAGLGIDVDAGEAEVERWFVAALFGARIPARVAERAFGVLAAAGLARIGQLRHVPTADLIGMLDAGGYARYDFRTATRLLQLCEVIRDRYDGQVALIGRRFAAYPELRAALDALPGWGPVTIR